MAVAGQFKAGKGVTVRGALEGLSEAHGTWGTLAQLKVFLRARLFPQALRVGDLSWHCDYTLLSNVRF